MKTTLQARLINLLVLSSLFLVSAFTLIQLNNHIQRTNALNIYRAKQAALLVRTNLQAIFADYDISKTSRSILMASIKDSFKSLLESGAIETIALLNQDGKPELLEGAMQFYIELDPKTIAQASDNPNQWITPIVDKTNKLVNVLVTFKNPFGYLVQLTVSFGNVQQALGAVYAPVIFTVFLVVIGNVVLGVLLSHVLIRPVKVLNQATKEVAGGNLDEKIEMHTKDELEELAGTFNYMTVELKKMKERAENANPLTKLPGNIVIREEVEKRLKAGEKFVLVYSDLDNFKAFNDKYGVEAGDKAITLTANIMKESVAKEGKADDFLGHEGGDDFLLLTIPERAQEITGYIIQEFDKRIRGLYLKEDLEKGYIEAKARGTEQVVKFPIMTISLAGVGNMKRRIDSYAQLTNIAAEMKKAAKKLCASNFLMDRRTEDRGKEARGA